MEQLARETEDWERISGVIDRLLRLETRDNDRAKGR
jgi:hypothetical protein